MRSKIASFSSSVSLPRLTARAVEDSRWPRPRVSAASATSTPTTSSPLRANTSTMPAPMVPRPTTPTLVNVRDMGSPGASRMMTKGLKCRRLLISQFRCPRRPGQEPRVTLADDRALERFPSHDPATGEVLETWPVDDETTVAEAVDRARLAALWWEDLGYEGRRERLLAWKGVITRRMRELAQLMHRENGKPVADATLEIIATIDHIDWAARHAKKVLGPRSVRPVAALGEPAGHPRVPAAGRGRRHRALELPRLHPDGLDRLRPGGGQRRRLQAVRAHARHRRLAGPDVRRGRARAPGAAARHRRRAYGLRAAPAPASTRSPSPARSARARRSWRRAPRR